MDPVSTIDSKVTFIDLNLKKDKISLFELTVVLFLLVSLAAVISFGVGYLIGKRNLKEPNSNRQQAKSSVQEMGKSKVYISASDKFSLVFPKDWTFKEKKDGTKGIMLTKEEVSIETFVETIEKLTFSSEQKQAIEKNNRSKLSISNREASMTEYVYKAGNYLTLIELNESLETPRITFLIKANNDAVYSEAKEIVKSLKFLRN
jgi:hypothetical protein